MPTSFRAQIEHVLGVPSARKPEIYLQVFTSADVASANYILELLLSAGIATLGLVLNSPAVVIGAMLISPLMGPILAGGLALAASDLYLGIKAGLSVMVGIAVSLAFSAFLVWLLPFHEVTAGDPGPHAAEPARPRRGALLRPRRIHRGVARRRRGGVTALPGVAIAVALMPPLCTVGFGIGSGWSWPIISGAGLLFVTNLAAIIASAFLVFFLVRFDAPSLRGAIRPGGHRQGVAGPAVPPARAHEALALARHDRRAALARVDAARDAADSVVPLRQSLYQVRDEAIGRTAVRDAVASITSPDSLLSQQVSVEPQHISVHLIVTAAVTADQVRQAEALVMRRTGERPSPRRAEGRERRGARAASRPPATRAAAGAASAPTAHARRARGGRPRAPRRPVPRALARRHRDAHRLPDRYRCGRRRGRRALRSEESRSILAVADVLARDRCKTRLKTTGLRVSLEYQRPEKPRPAGKAK